MKKDKKYSLPEVTIPFTTKEISMRTEYDIANKTFLYANHLVNIPTGITFRKDHYDITDASKVIYVNLDEAMRNKITWRDLDNIWEYHHIFRETHDYLFTIDIEQELNYILYKCGDLISTTDFEQILEKEDYYTRLLELAEEV